MESVVKNITAPIFIVHSPLDDRVIAFIPSSRAKLPKGRSRGT
jgi:hypothetical protein